MSGFRAILNNLDFMINKEIIALEIPHRLRLDFFENETTGSPQGAEYSLVLNNLTFLLNPSSES